MERLADRWVERQINQLFAGEDMRLAHQTDTDGLMHHTMNKIARRDFLKAAGVLGAAGLLTACGGSSSSTAASSTASSAAASSAAPASGDVTLTMSWWGR